MMDCRVKPGNDESFMLVCGTSKRPFRKKSRKGHHTRIGIST
jgi:hypothetical protein